ncbi:MAG TPA: hypothetical protein PKN44_15390 [Bacteroidales bacterium]|nr:hypothetical protein [Bacteroidales bacterium]
MTNRKKSVGELRKKLPYGSFTQIKGRLQKKEIKYSLQYISHCLSPDHPAYNNDIMEEAILVVQENDQALKDFQKRIDKLKNDPECGPSQT